MKPYGNQKAYIVLKKFISMKSRRSILKSASINELERTLDKCLVWFYAFPNSKIGLNDLSKSINSSKTATKEVVESLI